ncbi:AAA family ATPase [Arthrobacter castelli]|uniref:AAA family ATPase n=1 Tax=Arthrobacter castelli TaxID=271431 RepID=UPI0003F99980|nr:MoxR family ATPase [Arthrobacter castelli]
MNSTATMSIEEVSQRSTEILDEAGTVIVGMEEPLRLALGAVLAGGHVYFEDMPGLGKTLAAKSLAGVLGLGFRRVQCTPDLLPADITGSSIYDPAARQFEFRPGPIFTGLFLADEINRTSPKTQSALLEAMAERQVSVEGGSLPLPQPFHVFATSNPIEFEGTYPLPEAQLDRFLVRLTVGYPSGSGEAEIIRRRIYRRQEAAEVRTLCDPDTLLAMQTAVEHVNVDPDILAYAVGIAAATRNHNDVEVGASPRGSQAMILLSRALAAAEGRDFVVPEDIKGTAVPVLAHRLTLTPSSWARGIRPESAVEDAVNRVAAPPSVGHSA